MADGATPTGRVAVCPHCGTKLSVAGVPSGKALRCGQCKQLFKLRAPAGAPVAPPSPAPSVTPPATMLPPPSGSDALRTSRPPHPLARGASPVTAKPAASPTQPPAPPAKPAPAPAKPASPPPVEPGSGAPLPPLPPASTSAAPSRRLVVVGGLALVLVVALTGWLLLHRGGPESLVADPEVPRKAPSPPLDVVMAEFFRVPVEVVPLPVSTPSAPRRASVTARYDFSTGPQRQVWNPAYLVSAAAGGGCRFRLNRGTGDFFLVPRLEPPFRVELGLRLMAEAAKPLVLILDEGEGGRELRLEFGSTRIRAVVSGAIAFNEGRGRGPSPPRRSLQEGRAEGLPLLQGSPFTVVIESGEGTPPAVTVAGNRVRWDGPFSNESAFLAVATAPWGTSRLGLQFREVRGAAVVRMDVRTTVTIP